MSKPVVAERIYTINDLLYLMSRLRDPETGCPWDLQQDFASLAPYMLEEVYEAVDTIERHDLSHLAEELGDLLFQVVFHAQVASEQSHFDFGDVVNRLTGKLLARHPHVFPGGTLESAREPHQQISTTEINSVWEQKKHRERESKGHQGVLADIPAAFPALIRAQKIQKRAAKVGFDWTDVKDVINKVGEEIAELTVELPAGDPARLEDEIGDIFFSLVNLSRHLQVDAETSLRKATRKFEQRFSWMEEQIEQQGKSIDALSPVELDQYWCKAKLATDI